MHVPRKQARAAREADIEPLMRRGEVAVLFGVDPKTVSNWAIQGKLSAVWTPGGQRRFLRREVEALASARTDAAQVPA